MVKNKHSRRLRGMPGLPKKGAVARAAPTFRNPVTGGVPDCRNRWLGCLLLTSTCFHARERP
jgi:hypothetical protein